MYIIFITRKLTSLPWEEIFYKWAFNNGKSFSWINGLKLQLSNTPLVKPISHFSPWDSVSGCCTVTAIKCLLEWVIADHNARSFGPFSILDLKKKQQQQPNREGTTPKSLLKKKEGGKSTTGIFLQWAKSFYTAHHSDSTFYIRVKKTKMKKVRWSQNESNSNFLN